MRSDTSLRGAASLPRAFPTMRRASRQGPRMVYRAPPAPCPPCPTFRAWPRAVPNARDATPTHRQDSAGTPPAPPQERPQPPGPRRRPPLTFPESPAPGGCALTAPELPHCDCRKDRVGAPPGASTGSGANFALPGRCSPSGSRERQNLTFGGRRGSAVLGSWARTGQPGAAGEARAVTRPGPAPRRAPPPLLQPPRA